METGAAVLLNTANLHVAPSSSTSLPQVCTHASLASLTMVNEHVCGGPEFWVIDLKFPIVFVEGLDKVVGEGTYMYVCN